MHITPAGNTIDVLHKGAVTETATGDPLAWLAAYQDRYVPALDARLPRFCGGLAGYFGYDVVRVIEKKLRDTAKGEGLDTPDILLLHSDELVVVDNLASQLYVTVYAHIDCANTDTSALQAIYDATVARLAMLAEQLKYPAKPLQSPASQPNLENVPSPSQRSYAKADYLRDIAAAQALVLAGDCMQVQIGQRIAMPFTQNPLSLYRALRSINPSPYMYYYWLETAGHAPFHIVGASPEILVRQEPIYENGKEVARNMVLRPIAGTRKRGATPVEDAALAAELLADPKERAEHVMLIDLARNDIGRIAKTGSVRVVDTMVIEKYSHVQHIVSHVEGVLPSHLTNMDVLRASFPAGTLTGAPKVRAMEIINQFEPVKRGIYGGAVGYISYSGAMDLAIAIRTGVVQNGVLYAQASAGIVADSDMEAEYAETEAKARAVLRAAELVQSGGGF